MPQYVRWQEERRTSRRTVADALDVVGQDLAANEVLRARVEIGEFQLPSGKCTALVDVVFPDLGCIVSLPTSAQFRARGGMSSQHQVSEISRLDGAEVCPDGSVLLVDGTRLPYQPSELDERVLWHVISLMKAESYCYRSIREGLPEHLQDQVPDLHSLDYGRVRALQVPQIKVIRGYIAAKDPELRLSDQKIADALATFGVRVPRRRPRTATERAIARATI